MAETHTMITMAAMSRDSSGTCSIQFEISYLFQTKQIKQSKTKRREREEKKKKGVKGEDTVSNPIHQS